ncbi:2-oxoacid:acceptor oxidoreductase family protein [Gracilimonas mengyeensis]|uniref:Pyruvate ferredoxin oxidoreductase gamma subunit n=1 Tax=Gracilimonas mengyeensis TaxID=1302730 RepID=A0A521CJE4_9BACT|nr:2-oxoacid:acceptor oxidoreductase family protein [Gracilimonas mengyeensis]SMO59566.1 pyruvate ferredoxin oxidoreductase gamma subunit [Gracilimonas mengyeensis]
MMKEIRWHGRGGQGAKTVSELVALALMHHGYFVQAFPEYGPERSGAPLQAYTRSSDEPIRLHCGVTDPDLVVVLDDSLLHEIRVTEGLKPEGFILVNTKKTKEALRLQLGFDGTLYCINADKIAVETGLLYSNVVMAGALGGILGNPPLEDLKRAAEEFLSIKLSPKIVEINLKAIEAGFRESQHMEELA